MKDSVIEGLVLGLCAVAVGCALKAFSAPAWAIILGVLIIVRTPDK